MNNVFKNLLSKISKLRDGGEASAVGIDIGSSAIKVVEIKRKGGRAILETYGAIALGPYDALDVGRVTNLPVGKIVEALKEVLKQSGVTIASAGFSIPVQSSLIFPIELPSQVAEKKCRILFPPKPANIFPCRLRKFPDYFIPQKKFL